jgi:D-glycero-D-manno-heptose 1,7-bisphosphate phosphatase
MNLKNKICLPEDLGKRINNLKRPLVMTNGVFDVLHRGHVSYLERAANLGFSMLVAVNSDSSVRKLGKGTDRPLNEAEDRAYVLAGLSSIDMVTIFDDRTPVDLIRTVRPDFYVKGGDYEMDTLEESRVVRSWGGKAVAIPFVDGFSTTALLKRIRATTDLPQLMRKAVFLDRDGVINKDSAYVHRWDDFEFVPGAIEGMKRLQNAGYILIIVTNQSGLARGYYTEAQYRDLTNRLRQELAYQGVNIAGVYHCPHHPDGNVCHLAIECDCRKPAPGLVRKAANELGVSLIDSIMIGDKPSDIEAARAAGVARAYQVVSNNPLSSQRSSASDGHYPDLLSCVINLFPDDVN